MHQTLTFPDIPLTEDMAKLLFYGSLAEPHSIKSTGTCYLHFEMPFTSSTGYKDFKVKIIYKDQYKYSHLSQFLVITRTLLFKNGNLKSDSLMDDWNDDELIDEGYYRHNPIHQKCYLCIYRKIKIN